MFSFGYLKVLSAKLKFSLFYDNLLLNVLMRIISYSPQLLRNYN